MTYRKEKMCLVSPSNKLFPASLQFTYNTTGKFYLREIISPFAQLENRDLTLNCTVLASHVKIILDILVFLYNYFALRHTKTEETYNANSELHWEKPTITAWNNNPQPPIKPHNTAPCRQFSKDF